MKRSEVKEAARKFYELNRSDLERLKIEVEYGLDALVRATKVKTHWHGARVKELDSLLDKFDRKPEITGIETVDDLVGGRVVTLFRADLSALEASISTYFDVVDIENKIEEAAEDSFGYMSVHFVCRLHHSSSGFRYDGLKDFKFEVQLRTILMDAWANVSHYIDYKGEGSLPKELRKDFYALSALFYVADSSFENFHNQSIASKETAIRAVKSNIPLADIPLNADTLRAFLLERFPSRHKGTDYDYSELTEELLKHAKFTSIEDLQRATDGHLDEAISEELKNPPLPDPTSLDGQPDDGRYIDVGIMRVLAKKDSPEYAEYRRHIWWDGAEFYFDEGDDDEEPNEH